MSQRADLAGRPSTPVGDELSRSGLPGSAALTRPWIENAPSRTPSTLPALRELWQYRHLVSALAVRDLKLRYKQTVFGVAWALIQPLTAAAIFTIIFGRLADVPSDDIPYAVFVYAGLALWLYVSTAVQAAAECLVENNKLVTNVYFPRVLAPLAAVLPGLLDLGLSLVILAGFMAVYGVVPSAALVLLPLWIATAVALAFAVGVWLSGLNVLYRDVRYAFGFVVQVWLFASPVVFPSSLVDGAWRYLFAINPMAGLLDAFRWSAVGAPAPGVEDLVSLFAGVVVLLSGVAYFRRIEADLADRI